MPNPRLLHTTPFFGGLRQQSGIIKSLAEKAKKWNEYLPFVMRLLCYVTVRQHSWSQELEQLSTINCTSSCSFSYSKGRFSGPFDRWPGR